MQLYTRPDLKGQPTHVDEGEGSFLTAVPVAPKAYHKDKMIKWQMCWILL